MENQYSTESKIALCSLVREKKAKIGITFAGQANDYLQELRNLWQRYAVIKTLVKKVEISLQKELETPQAVVSGYFSQGLSVSEWLQNEKVVPDNNYLFSSPISQPLVLLTQISNYLSVCVEGYPNQDIESWAEGTTGHSQGIVASLILSMGLSIEGIIEETAVAAKYLLWQGFRMQESHSFVSSPETDKEAIKDLGTPAMCMVSIQGFTSEELQKILDFFNANKKKKDYIYLSLDNESMRKVLSGSPDSLEKLRLYFKNEYPKKYPYPLRNIRFTYLNTSAPFHCAHMEPCIEPLLNDIKRIKWNVDPSKLKIPVYSPFTGQDIRNSAEIMREIIEVQSIRPVYWKKGLLPFQRDHQVTHILDFGPGNGIAKLVNSYMQGFGIQVLSVCNAEERQQIVAHDSAKINFYESWQKYLPKVVTDNKGQKLVNAFTQFCGRSPVILPGMTPVTVTADIVVAAANAGYVSELAGGGQVTEKMFRDRMEEIKNKISPEQGVVLNTLYLDPYLWNLQIRQQQMVFKLKEEGYPFIGITVSAGIPPVAEAVALLHKLHQSGMFLNAFKAGTDEQVQQILSIADACPEYNICLHIEGGLAGGHHGWNDLRHVLIRNYRHIRDRENVLVLVGGGIREEKDAVEFLMGTWNREFDLPIMPMDGVFLGTLAMACLESEVSEDCKKALVAAPGTKSWSTFLATGEVKGSITSGKSPLDADIYYLENTATKLGRLLDRLVGDAAGIQKNRTQIIDLLNQSSRPYFGDLDSMSYFAVLKKMITFMATGNNSPYEDGIWLDITYRLRFEKMLQRALARFSSKINISQKDMQKPKEILDEIDNAHPQMKTVPLAPEDKAFFVYQVCQIPGKPVNFVPVVDENIRKWYKSDSLHSCNESRFAADEVFQTPGPRAIGGITKINEPVADLFGRFHKALVDNAVAETEQRESSETCELSISVHDNIACHGTSYWKKYQGNLALLLQSACISRNNNMMRNFVHDLLKIDHNKRLQLKITGTNLLEVVLQECEHDEWNSILTLQINADKNIALNIHHSVFTAEGVRNCTFSTFFECHPQRMSPYHISEIEQGRTQRIADFYVGLLLDETPNVEVQEQSANFSLTAEHIRNYISSLNGKEGDFKTAPLSMAFVIAWQPIFRLLLRPDCLGDLFTLVHLANRIAKVDKNGLVANKEYNIRAVVKEISYAKEGKKVVVIAQISYHDTAVVILESEFLLREKVASELLGTKQFFPVPFEYPKTNEKVIQSPYYAYEKRMLSPKNGNTYALVSKDFNPLHRDKTIAQLAGFDLPIVHGMWSKGMALQAFRQEEGVKHRNILRIETQFSAPALHSQKMSTYARHIAMNQGQKVFEIYCAVEENGQRIPTVTGKVYTQAPEIALVFPGQGIQAKGMGMESYAHSKAAQKIWDDADIETCKTFGFSILQVVRENPTQLRVRGEVLRHEKGVLFLTQFTQVALVVHALANIAELKESDIYVPNHYFCGHSIGEYSAISACSDVLSLEKVIKVVYQRGLTMQNFVPRDEKGKSSYRMGVISPHRAKLNEEQALSLVNDIRQKTGKTLEVVNYNVRGRQYAIAGDISAIEALKQKLEPLSSAEKPAYIDIPGLDVPFHSSVLKKGVEHFREVLIDIIREDSDFLHLEGRYIPNLVASPFELSEEFFRNIYNITQSPVMKEMLDNVAESLHNKNDCARKVLIELLAYQFAFPVRWIETQDILLQNENISAIWEIGVGYQPTLTNMFGQTMAGNKQAFKPVYNIERDRNTIYFLNKDNELPPLEAVQDEIVEEIVAEKIEATAKIESSPTPRQEETGHCAPPETSPVKHALFSILALQTKIWPEEMQESETIDQLLGGNSSRRNQSVVDIWSEFNIAPIDGAHEIPLAQLKEAIEAAVGNRYNSPGAYLKVAHTEAIKRIFAKVGNITLRDVINFLKSGWDIDDATIYQLLSAIAIIEAIDVSSRGNISSPVNKNISNKKEAHAFIENVLQHYRSICGWNFARKATASSGEKVDAQALDKVLDRYFGTSGAFSEIAKFTQYVLGQDPYDLLIEREKEILENAEAVLYQKEHGPHYLQTISPRFNAKKMRSYTSAWNWVRSHIAKLYWDLKNNRIESMTSQIENRILASPIPEVKVLIAGLKNKAEQDSETKIATIFSQIENKLNNVSKMRYLELEPSAPSITIDENGVHFSEVCRGQQKNALDFVVNAPVSVQTKLNVSDDSTKIYHEILKQQATEGVLFTNKVALVTGAGEGAIATAIVRNLLRGGATVIVTTTKPTLARLEYYKNIYKDYAGTGAELHVCPFNQGSTDDIDKLVHWIYQPTETRPAWQLDYFIPFGAVPEENNLVTLDDSSMATLRVMLFGVEYMLGKIAKSTLMSSDTAQKVQVILPLSPNHGQFGNDGFYAETKIGLEALLNKWQSEYDVWGKVCSLIGAKIGWVRGTSLMSANDVVAAGLEEKCNVRTYSCDEMGFFLTGLLHKDLCTLAAKSPLTIDLMGGMDKVPNLSKELMQIRLDIEKNVLASKKVSNNVEIGNNVLPLNINQFPVVPDKGRLESLNKPSVDLNNTIVIVGYGEVGTFGNAQIRWDQETQNKLSETRALELARIIGLIKFSISRNYVGWVDVASEEPIDECTVAHKYQNELIECFGVRELTPEHARFDPHHFEVYSEVPLENEIKFRVDDKQTAQSYKEANPDKIEYFYDKNQDCYWVLLRKATKIRVPKKATYTRTIGGQVPKGWHPHTFGLPNDMCQQLDFNTQHSLIGTADAFVNAGIEPEELYKYIHPSKVGNTLGSGLGGGQSLSHLARDFVLDRPRQGDRIQETLVNVMGAYNIQNYIGSYGSVASPANACATAAISVEIGMEKILAGKADFIVAGSYDDITDTGVLGFKDMNATANTNELKEKGFLAHEMSRPNDVMRSGFVEAQGGGTILLCRANVALEAGLPVYGIVAMATSATDGVNLSIPAPGLGLLNVGSEDQKHVSPLREALNKFGLTINDISVVSKHDTSTQANDKNESELYHTLMKKLGRVEGLPLMVISQKSLTGHSKGGAAAWQLNGLLQAMDSGLVPGNRNLMNVDNKLKIHTFLSYNDETIEIGRNNIKAALITSLGFGHVGSMLCVVHPDVFFKMLTEKEQESYLKQREKRWQHRYNIERGFLIGEKSIFRLRDKKPFSDNQEKEMLLSPDYRSI